MCSCESLPLLYCLVTIDGAKHITEILLLLMCKLTYQLFYIRLQ